MDRIKFTAFQGAISSRREQVTLVFLFALAMLYGLYLFSLAIEYSDSDLWYHLTGGKYLLDEGRLYNPFVNSYLTPPQQPYTNYFWGFQLAAYMIWSAAGEFGLIVVKAGCFLAAGLFTTKIILRDQAYRYASVLQLLVIATVLAILCARGFSLRPHVVSYLFIPLFIFILAYRPKLYPLLPLFTILWVNFHGVEWVVGALICGAYFLQRLSDFWQSEDRDPETLKPLWWIAACLPAILINPNHFGLILTPFLHDAGLKLFISELRPFSFEASAGLYSGISRNALVFFLMLFAANSLLVCLPRASKHLAEILLATGGLILLMIAMRFVWEWALLTTPLIASGLRIQKGPELSGRTASFLVLTLGALSWTFWPHVVQGWQHYPYDKHSLPYGTHRFIESKDIQGKFAVAPSYAGFTEFELSPDIKIHMDMQFPPFTSVNFQELSAAFYSKSGLQTYVAKYEPDLFGIRKSNTAFDLSNASELGYKPVFFDQHLVLFINASKYPELTREYELQAIDPFNEGRIQTKDVEKGIIELERMVYAVNTPDVKLTLAGYLLETGKIQKAEIIATELVEQSPRHAPSLYYYGRAKQLLGDCVTAIDAYERALRTAAVPHRIHLHAAQCYFVNKQLREAYEHFSKSIDLFSDPNPDSRNLFQFALASIAVGDETGAKRILKMLNQYNPKAEFSANARALLEELETREN
ncbi:MAG: tetratricopeptide (TPR) repeat protein [Candidatus Azotimanducaceae bacterium]